MRNGSDSEFINPVEDDILLKLPGAVIEKQKSHNVINMIVWLRRRHLRLF
jgi:hypothetical protein